jgi:very-short-patch-repair endonuclease
MSVSSARALRERSTEAERLMWSKLRDRRLVGHKFRRQHPLGPYVVDFACVERNLVVELDGGQHASAVEADLQRTRALGKLGFRVVRFWNNDVLDNPDGVLRAIAEALSGEGTPLP